MNFRRVMIITITATILLVAVLSTLAPYRQVSLAGWLFQRSVNYDLNGDGFVTREDMDIYALAYQGQNDVDVDFNGDGVIDIFDQTLIALEVIEIQKVYLPVIYK